MKRQTAIGALALTGVIVLSLAGCGEKEPQQTKITYSATVESVEHLELVTGPNSANKTDEYAVGGCDLGFPIYNSKNNTMYLAFGDTFMDAPSQSGLWRSNVLAYSTDYDLTDGLSFDGFITNGGRAASAIIDGYHLDSYEMTKIPTGGIEVNGVMYMFYFSKYSWNNDAKLSMNYGGAVKSEDNGKSWSRVNDLSWLDDSMPERKAEIEKMANQDINLKDTDAGITMETHAGYSFTQVCPIDGKDGYVYILGEGGYRTAGIKLGRVKYAEIESFEAYEYYNGVDGAGNPVWLKGSAGLKTVDKNNGAYIINDVCSEQSVMYNKYLNKWMVVYLRGGKGIVYRTADNLYGPYSDMEVLMSYEFPFEDGVNSIYGGLVHEKYTEQNGKVFYFFLSRWKPVYNASLVKVVLA